MANGSYNKTSEEQLGELLTNKRGTESVRVVKSMNDKSEISYDIRRWFLDEDDEWKPSKKGISIKEEMLTDVIKLVLADNPDLLGESATTDETNQ